jgi:hypothetical protein
MRIALASLVFLVACAGKKPAPAAPAANAAPPPAAEPAPGAAPTAGEAPAAPAESAPPTTRGPMKKGRSGDPCEGGQ